MEVFKLHHYQVLRRLAFPGRNVLEAERRSLRTWELGEEIVFNH